MAKMIGIDLGTTNSVVAIADGATPRVLDSLEGQSQTRSMVGLNLKKPPRASASATAPASTSPPATATATPTSAEILVGDDAYDNWEVAPKDTIHSVKRLMGRAVGDPQVEKIQEWARYQVVEPDEGTRDSLRVVMGDRQYAPVDISAMILKKLKADAEVSLGGPVTHAVITVPAYFSQVQRDATRKAGIEAGLVVIKILDEPTAASIAFAVQEKIADARTILVYDLGGGTFDISILVAANDSFAPLNLEGDMWLGGDDLDHQVEEMVLRHVRQEHGPIDLSTQTRFLIRLRKEAQKAKERLTTRQATSVIIPSELRNAKNQLVDVDCEITREQFERAILPLIAPYKRCPRCGDASHPTTPACKTCKVPLSHVDVTDGRAISLVKKALETASLRPSDIDCVLMAGSATRVPLVLASVIDLFGADRVQRKIHPKHAVAQGAAIVAARVGARVVCHARAAGAKLECGQVNPDDAPSCSRCGASLVGSAGAPQPDIHLSGIAPFSYGMQTSGDRFNLFIAKGDPFPTETLHWQTFYTQRPDQRMINIPVYGGESRDCASDNEKQGEVFAVLPSRLPADTPVHVALWLDGDGVFQLKTRLDGQAAPTCWLIKGEGDARAIRGVELAERVVAEHRERATREQMTRIEHLRDDTFAALARHSSSSGDFTEVQACAERLVAMTAEWGRPDEPPLHERARNLIHYSEGVIRDYSFAIENKRVDEIREAVARTRAALEGGAPPAILEMSVDALCKTTDGLPELVQLLLSLRCAIDWGIAPRDRLAATKLRERLRNLHAAFQIMDDTAGEKLRPLAQDIARTLERLDQEQGPMHCAVCGAWVPPGQRRCPEGHDNWLLKDRTRPRT